IDPRLPDDTPAARPGLAYLTADVRTYRAAPFHAVAFTASLHHIAPLDAALDAAVALLAPGGALVIDDFDLDAPDLATLRWDYDAQELLAAAGAYDAAHVDGAPGDDPRARWEAGHAPHHDEAPLHGGAAMLAGIAARFHELRVVRGPYLWRHIARRVTHGARSG